MNYLPFSCVLGFDKMDMKGEMFGYLI